MPQMVAPVPAGKFVTVEVLPPERKTWMITGFSFGGRTVTATEIPPYDFTTGKGLAWKGEYIQIPPLESFTAEFYLTSDYLEKFIKYPRYVTRAFDVTITNTLDEPAFLSMTCYLYQVPLSDALKAMGYR